MQESKRQSYLRTLGVDLWLPKQLLDAAGESRPAGFYDVGTEKEATKTQVSGVNSGVNSEVRSGVGSGVKKAREMAATLRQDTRVKAKTITVEPEPVAPAESSEAPVPEPEFAYVLYKVSSKKIIMVEYADSSAPGLSRSELILLENILKTQGLERFQWDIPQAPCFRWPMIRTESKLDSGWEEASEALSGFLQKHVVNTSVICLGCSLLACFDKNMTELDNKPLVLAQQSISINVTYSLKQMLEEGMLKRHCWEQIKHW